MGSAYGAGAGADMLQQVLRQKALEQQAQARLNEEIRQANMQNQRFYSGQDFQAGQNKLGREFTHGENEAAHTFTHGENQAGRDFTHGENQLGREFTSGENQKGREFTAGENLLGRGFTAGEAQKGRIFTGGQNDLNRANALKIVGIQGENALATAGARQVVKPPTGAERQTLNYFNRMLEAEKNARGVEDKIGNFDSTVSDAPGVPGFLENWLHTDAGQKYVQAQRMFTEARLRKESGAAIPEPEFANDRRMNFRSSGDTAETLTQKRNSRVTTMRGLGNAAGKAIQEFYGENATIDDLLKDFADQPATMRARDPQGVLHEAPAGTALPPGWKLEK